MINNYKEHIQQKLLLLPDLPGCYLMKNENNEIIYVGKAKNLKNRVRSYFKQAHDGKTQLLVQDIRDFETIITNTNKESLLLEITLIKKYQPKYNIKLKDSKAYPYLKITNEKDPQLIITQDVVHDGGYYFGPYTDITAATQTQQLLYKSFPLRRCSKNEKRACFYYHLDQCIGCCDHEIPKEVYNEQIKNIKNFLNGNVSHIKKQLVSKMNKASENLEFEKAIDYRNQIHYIETTVEKQNILSKEFNNSDLFGFYIEDNLLSIQVFLLRQSSIIKREATIFNFYSNPYDEVVSFILQFYAQNNHIPPKEIIVPNILDTQLLEETLGITITSPQKGKKKSMLDLAIKNSQIALHEKIRLEKLKQEKRIDVCHELAQQLNITSANTIEIFDHSNTQGTNPVSAMVVFQNGKANKKLYRKFKIKTVTGSNEFATTQEVIRRRYTRLLKENKPLPDLILMDGGVIQIHAAKEVIEDELGLSIPVAGLQKNDKHNTDVLLFGNPLTEIKIEKTSELFKFLNRMQDEVHRFAITFHRQVRSKETLSSKLDNIYGVGEKTKQKLLLHFRSIEEMKKYDSIELRREFKKLNISNKTIDNILSDLSLI